MADKKQTIKQKPAQQANRGPLPRDYTARMPTASEFLADTQRLGTFREIEPIPAAQTSQGEGTPSKRELLQAHVSQVEAKAQPLPPVQPSRQLADNQPTENQTSVAPFEFLSVADIMAMPDIEWAIHGWLAMNQLTVVYGESGAGKTFFMLDLLARFRLGLPWHGIKTRPFADYIYFCLESSGGLKQRLKAYYKENLQTFPEMKIWPRNFNLIDEADRLIASVPTGSLVVIDTLSAATTGYDDSSNEDMGKAIAIGYRLIQERKATVFYVHHTGKDATKGARGGYVLKANVDNVWRLEKCGSKVKVVGEKIKEGESGNHVFKAFELAVLAVGETSDGEIVTSCAVREVNESDLPDKPKLKSTPDRKIALETLVELYKNNDEKPVHLDTWRPTFYKLSASPNDGAKEQAFLRARKALADNGIVEVDGYFYKPLREFI